MKNYIVKNIDIDPRLGEKDLSPLAAMLISASNLTDEQLTELLDPDMTLTTSSADCVLAACRRILEAKAKGEKVFVGGDYDADGICSTSIMKGLLDQLGIPNGYYIPDRFTDGYGLNPKTVNLAAKKGYTLIITVDNGVKAHEALAECRRLGLSTIVTDHHTIEEPVDCDILVHPNFMEERYVNYSGAGVALEIAKNLVGDVTDYIAMAAVAAIGDVMPLWKETRKLVKNGIEIMKTGRPLPLVELFKDKNEINETSIGFQVVPKLNSLGRMNDVSNVNTMVPYMLSKDNQAIQRYAAQVDEVNDARKRMSQTQTEIAESLIKEPNAKCFILFSPLFHEGVCGLVAGRIMNKYHVPTIVLAESGDNLKGSARSVEGINIFDAIKDYDKLVAFGGHAMAAGLTIRKDDLEDFRLWLNDRMSGAGGTKDNAKNALLISENDITVRNILGIRNLSPYPKDMFEPLFAVKSPDIADRKEYQKVTKLTIASENSGFEAVAFTANNISVPEKPNMLVGTLSINEYRGKQTPQMVIEGSE